ncbi:NEP1-interacting protein 1 [Arachis ipaensis]|uniref:NEP1-interacting protein 1 n=1 Tax=Arachis ipaensis TaxID=130454 RepID=UPI0007AF0F12|nr:NEP1-interacting protein 1 [Arachis ipaensis]XP_025668772.1 NEP1-interacting protein 1 isoform X2 [Arachis hypogaea]
MVATRCKEVFFGIFMAAMETLLYAAFTLILALGGSIVGTIAGGIKGQTTEAGFLDGAGKGAVTGAIAAIELLNSRAIDDPLTKMNTAETSSQREVSSNIYENKGVTGMAQSVILNLPFQKFKSKKLMYMSSCSICFQDFEDEELIRILPKCGHIFHLQCIDKWLIQQGSCPMCRTHVSSYHIHHL